MTYIVVFTCAQNEVVLSNGTLLFLETSLALAGRYQCMAYYRDEPLNSTVYHVIVTQGIEGRMD